jgi:hypothetical protein
MMSFTTNWEDEESNRILELAVECIVDGELVEVRDVTPRRVTFVDAATSEPVRSIGVHTQSGRDHLVQVCHSRGAMDHIRSVALEGQFALSR